MRDFHKLWHSVDFLYQKTFEKVFERVTTILFKNYLIENLVNQVDVSQDYT